MPDSRTSRFQLIFPPLISLAAGSLLLFSAGAKARQIAINPAAFLGGEWLKTAELLWLPFEAALGLWLLTNLRGRSARWVAASVFFIFSLATAYKWHSQETSCGCFGELAVRPSSMLVLDICMMISLVVAAQLSLQCGPTARRWALTALALAYGVATAATGFGLGNAHVTISKDGVLVQQVLVPGDWVGHEMPLLDHIDVGDELRRGEWILLLYRHDCPQCQQVLATIADRHPPDACRVCAVQVPPYGPESQHGVLSGRSLLRGRLNDKRNWFVPTPVLISLSDGMVKQVNIQDGAVDAAKRGFGKAPD